MSEITPIRPDTGTSLPPPHAAAFALFRRRFPTIDLEHFAAFFSPSSKAPYGFAIFVGTEKDLLQFGLLEVDMLPALPKRMWSGYRGHNMVRVKRVKGGRLRVRTDLRDVEVLPPEHPLAPFGAWNWAKQLATPEAAPKPEPRPELEPEEMDELFDTYEMLSDVNRTRLKERAQILLEKQRTEEHLATKVRRHAQLHLVVDNTVGVRT